MAWITQIFLGYMQLRAFNRMLMELPSDKIIKMGRTKGNFKPRTLVALVLDHDETILEAKIMKGFTVFARPKAFNEIIGSKYPLPANLITRLDVNINEALEVAFSKK